MHYFCQGNGADMNQSVQSCVSDLNGASRNDTGFRFYAESGNINTTSQFKVYGLK